MFFGPKKNNFSIRIFGPGEELEYKDNQVELIIYMTYFNGYRYYCNSFKRDKYEKIINIDERLNIIYNLCVYFKSKNTELIFVIDENDSDKNNIIEYIETLKMNHHRLKIEIVTNKKKKKNIKSRK